LRIEKRFLFLSIKYLSCKTRTLLVIQFWKRKPYMLLALSLIRCLQLFSSFPRTITTTPDFASRRVRFLSTMLYFVFEVSEKNHRKEPLGSK